MKLHRLLYEAIKVTTSLNLIIYELPTLGKVCSDYYLSILLIVIFHGSSLKYSTLLDINCVLNKKYNSWSFSLFFVFGRLILEVSSVPALGKFVPILAENLSIL